MAAFDHRHIFIDPAPDGAHSFAERKRLFGLARSSWEDYDRRLISKGGGVHSRQAKSVPLSAEARGLLGIDASAAPPNDVIRAILRMPVDLLWNGGIGTYVKAADESHAEIGDRANDAVRVNGSELRCRVVGEGGNLGFSQRGRIEYAAAGGRINTDFIDNSAGVNCSDVEVNLKILLNPLTASGRLPLEDRNELLAGMTDEVARLVLRNNYLQSLAISTVQARAAERIAELGHVIHTLERGGSLDRNLEALPTADEVADRRRKGQGLTRPELVDAAVLFQDLALEPTRGNRRRGRPVPRRRADALFPGARAATSSRARCRSTSCGARSSSRRSPTAWSTAWARCSRSACRKTPARTSAASRAPTRSRARSPACATCGPTSRRSTTRRRPRSSTTCWSRPRGCSVT